jgi:hypothetical protein
MFEIEIDLFSMQRTKASPKRIQLTDVQQERLSLLSELDGLDPAEHARRAIDVYLKTKQLDFTPPKAVDIEAIIKDRSDHNTIVGATWLSGTVDRYEFSILYLKNPAKTSLDRDRISKLSIWDPVILEASGDFSTSCIVNYDRGWDIRPSRMAEPYYVRVKDLIDQKFSNKTP